MEMRAFERRDSVFEQESEDGMVRPGEEDAAEDEMVGLSRREHQ
jgi:hypothetical protein